MKICPYCRNTMATGQTICDMCGELVPDVEMISKKSITLKPKKAPEQIRPESQSDDGSDGNKHYKLGLSLIILIAVVIIAGGIALTVLLL